MAEFDPYAGLVRRGLNDDVPQGVDPYAALVNNAAPLEYTPEEQAAAVQDTTSQFGRGLRRSLSTIGAAVPALYGAGANIISQGAGDSALDTAIGMMRRGAEAGPRINSLSEIHSARDAGDYAAGMLGSAIPDVGLAIAGGGFGGAAVKGIARKAALDAAESYATRAVAKRGIGELAADSVASQGEAAATRAATAGAVEQETARVAPRFLQAAEANTPAAVVKAGEVAGATAGMYPSTVASSAEGAPDANGNMVGGLKGAGAGDTLKILLGDAGAALVGSLPEVRALGRLGGPAVTDAIAAGTKAFMPRVAKEMAVQGALGGAAGVAQTAAQLATHKWVNDNVGLMSPTALQSYLDAGFAGTVMGAGMGGGIEGAHALPGAVAGAFDTAALRTKIRENLAAAADRSRAAYAKAKPYVAGVYNEATTKAAGAFSSKFGKGDGPAPGEPMPQEPGGPQPPTDGTPAGEPDIAQKVGETAGKVHAYATDLFSKVYDGLKSDEGRAAFSGGFADSYDKVKSTFADNPIKHGFDTVMASYKEALNRASKTPEAGADIQKAFAPVLEELQNAPPAQEGFAEHLNGIQKGEALDTAADDAASRLSERLATDNDSTLAPVPTTRLPKDNPVQLDDPLHNGLAAALPLGSVLWRDPALLQTTMAAAGKLFNDPNRMTWQDHHNLDALRADQPDLVHDWEGVSAPRYHEMQTALGKVAPEAEAPAAPANPAMQEAMDLAQQNKAAAGDAAVVHSPNVDVADSTDTGAGVETGSPRTVAAASQESRLREKLTTTPLSSPEHASVQKAYRDELLNSKLVSTENTSTDASRKYFADKEASPTVVELPSTHAPINPKVEAFAAKERDAANAAGQDGQALYDRHIQRFKDDPSNERRQLLSLDGLMTRHRAQLRALTGDEPTPRELLLGALGDLHLAGIEFDPHSLKPGSLGKDSKGRDLGSITAADIKGITESNAFARGTKMIAPEERAAAKAQARAKTDAFSHYLSARDQHFAARDAAKSTANTLHNNIGTPREAATRVAMAEANKTAKAAKAKYESSSEAMRKLLPAREVAERLKAHSALLAEPMTQRESKAGMDPLDFGVPDLAHTKVTRSAPPSDATDPAGPVTSNRMVENITTNEPFQHLIDQVKKMYRRTATAPARTETHAATKASAAVMERDIRAARAKAYREYDAASPKPKGTNHAAASAAEARVREAAAAQAKPAETVDVPAREIELRAGINPRERAVKIRELGVKIGETILAKEYKTGALNSQRYVRELRNLHDEKHPSAQKYFDKAEAGKLDDTFVKEQQPDNPVETRVREKDARAAPGDVVKTKAGEVDKTGGTTTKYGGADAYAHALIKKAGGEPPRTFSANDHVDMLLGKRDPDGVREGGLIDRSARTANEERYIAALRDATQDVGEHNAIRRALDTFDATRGAKLPEQPHDATSRQMRNQPDNPRDRTSKALDEQVLAKNSADEAARTKAEVERTAKLTPKERAAEAEKTREAQRVLREEEKAKAGNHVDYDSPIVKDAVTAAGKDNGDLKTVERGLNALLRRMGIKDMVRFEHSDTVDPVGGSYNRKTQAINVGRNLHGEERLEVISHELGHHIIRSELARAMGVDIGKTVKLSHEQAFDALAEHNPELHSSILEDYSEWLISKATGDASAVDALASRKPFFREKGIRANSEGVTTTLAELRASGDARYGYIKSVEEYMADQISRALTNSAATSPAAKFFKGIATKLKIAYGALFKGAGGKHAAAPSIEKWVQSMFDRTTLSVSKALKEPVTAEFAKTATEAALHAEMATRAAEVAAGVTPPPTPPIHAGPIGPSPPIGPKGLKSLVTFINGRLRPQERAILDRVLQQGKVIRRMDDIYKDQPGALRAMSNAEHGIEARIAYGYLAYEKGLLNAGPNSRSVLRGLGNDLINIANLAGDSEHAERIFSDIADGTIERYHALNRTYDVRQLEAQYRGKSQEVLNKAGDVYRSVAAPLAKVLDSSVARMRATGVPALASVAGKLVLHTGETGKDSGLIPAVTHNTDVFMHKAAGVFESLSKTEMLHFLNAVQQKHTESVTGNAKVNDAIKQWRALDDRFLAYANEAGLKFKSVDDHFPVVMDITTPTKRTAMANLLSAPNLEKGLRLAMGKTVDGPNGERIRKPSLDPIARLVERMTASAERRSPANETKQPFQADGGEPGFSGANKRLMEFIYKDGTPEQKRAFADLQSKDAALIMSRYVVPLVKQAESVRRFGRNDERLTALLDKAKRQGATDAQIQHARDAVDGARGVVGIDGSPTLRRLLGDNIANKIAQPSTRKGMAYVQAYQNARLLPLSLISSIVDPMGIAVRTGGDFKTAWDGFKFGMKTLTNKTTREEALGMLRTLGSADDFFTNETLQNGYGGMGENGARKVNDLIFKANGLASWTRATRFMALQSAHGFLAKHTTTPGKHSARFMQELGIRAGDITTTLEGRVKVLSETERTAASPAERAADDRVRSALLRFVDEAILRPNSQQAPNWMADPYMGLVSQYKQFAYAIHDQISGRIRGEMKHGNSKPVLAAMSYLPIVVMTEMLRGVIQYGPGGNPQRKNWGPEDYATFAAMRSGLLGPKLSYKQDALGDISRKRMYGASFAGPTAQQAGQVVSALSGQRSVGKTLESALPGEVVYKHWNDGAQTNASTSPRTTAHRSDGIKRKPTGDYERGASRDG